MKRAEAQALAYAIESGTANTENAQAWADSEIFQATEPSEELLTLATERNVAKAISLLHALGVGAKKPYVGRMVYRHLLTALEHRTISHERAAGLVVRLAREGVAPSPEAEDGSWYFDDAFYLASQGICGHQEEVSAELETHLKKYAD